MFSNRYRESKNSRPDSRDRDRSPLPRMNLAETTNDPGTVTARIFVGSIVDPVPRETICKHFSKWGTVTGVSITKHNFGFVQFSSPSEAQACLADGYFTYLNELKLDVKPARIGPNLMASHGPGPSRPGVGRGKFNDREPNYTSYSDGRREDYYPPSYYSSRPEQKRDNFGASSDSYHNDYRIDYRDYYERDRERGRDRETGNGYGGYFPSTSSSSYPADTARGSALADICSTDTPESMDRSQPNDVEIVVPNKLQRGYAERIENRLKRVGLLVDLLFPPSEIPSHQVLNDLSSRKCLFAIFITPENEKHNSLTLNILHGETQEHRNMPVEDALFLVQQNFATFVKKNSQRNLRHVVPRDIRNLLLDLIETRPLSMGDLDKTIKYLKERQNSLVDDQIEQKRDAAGTQSTAIARSMAVTYPGYNYLTTTIPGTVNVSTPSHTTMGAPIASVGIVQTAPVAAQASAYPTYGTVPAVMNAYTLGSAQLGGRPPTANIIATAAGPLTDQTKQNELQERILSLMKSQGGIQVTGLTAPPPVPAPSVVPPPTVVPPPRMMHAAQAWSTAKPPEMVPKPASQAVYNPWTQ